MKAKRMLGFVSSYSREGAEDLLFFSSDERGMMREEGRFRIGGNPSYLCKDGDTLYVGLETQDEAVILSFHVTVDGGVNITKTGQLKTGGSGLCHIWAGSNAVYGCCYGSGDMFAVDKRLRQVLWNWCPNRDSGAAPHAHCSMETENGRFLVEADLGMDAVYGFPLTDGGVAGNPILLAGFSGTGPRQVLYERESGQFLAVGEMGNSMTGFLWLPGQTRQTWEKKWMIPATKRPGTNYPGGACSSDDGIVFWGNRGADTIAALRAGEKARFLGEWDCEGSWPRDVLVSDGCVYAACQKSGTLESFVWDGYALKKADRLILEEAACVIAWDFQREVHAGEETDDG